MALLLVLVVVALLTSLLVDLGYSTLVDMRLTETFRDSTKAYYLAKGGINAGRMIVVMDKNQYDSKREAWSKGVANYPVGEGSVSIAIEDQDGKLALNALMIGNNPAAIMLDRFYRLLVLLELDDEADPAELTAALIDWLDADDVPFAEINTDNLSIPVTGAESSYYRTLKEPYPCKNGPLETLEELTLVRGFTPELVRRVSPHLTVNGTMQVNINTASKAVLMSLDPAIDENTANIIIDFRQEQSISTIAQLEEILPTEIYAILKTFANLKRLGTTSQIYRIESTAQVNDGSRRLIAEINKDENGLLFFKVN
ncbi:MAG TPA: type II secretion system minor pseudopilin GspK [Desulfuromonadales bacterium]|nr:type II secretion system minor pseudopilin GspK [Desulfuromonadales bacterium]